MKAGLLSILADVVTPLNLARRLAQRVEGAGTGTDEDRIPRDRGNGEDSTTRVVAPEHLRLTAGNTLSFLLRLSATRRRRQEDQIESEKQLDHRILHCYSTPS